MVSIGSFHFWKIKIKIKMLSEWPYSEALQKLFLASLDADEMKPVSRKLKLGFCIRVWASTCWRRFSSIYSQLKNAWALAVLQVQHRVLLEDILRLFFSRIVCLRSGLEGVHQNGWSSRWWFLDWCNPRISSWGKRGKIFRKIGCSSNAQFKNHGSKT